MELNYQLTDFAKHQILKTDGYWNYTETEKLLDPLCGNTSFIFGYNNKTILNSMVDLQSRIGFLRGMNNETCSENEELISSICGRGDFEHLTWAVSGSDAVEAAIYINDAYWKSQGKDKPTVVTFSPGYHGTTYLAKLFREEYSVGERAMVIQRSTDDNETIQALEVLLLTYSKIGAVLIESAPWAGGLRLWTPQFWKSVRDLCHQHDVNFIVDDVLGGVGKLGYFFSHQRYGVQPDIVALGKSLTNGYSPLSCACTNAIIGEAIKEQWNFGHTWTPNMGGVGAALAVDKMFNSIDFLKIEHRLTDIGKKFKSQKLIKDFVSAGLLFYLELDKEYPKDILYRAGINGNINDSNGIFICAPAIADEEYFTELETRLLSVL